MQSLEQPNQRATDLYWLAFLLTGHRGLSVDVTLQTMALPEDDNPFFSAWMLAWARRVFIAKALAAIRGELAASARKMASGYAEKAAFPPRNWTLARGTTKVQLESALLAIDVFPDALFCCRSSKACPSRTWRSCWMLTRIWFERPRSSVCES
jgi:hypothetical protein